MVTKLCLRTLRELLRPSFIALFCAAPVIVWIASALMLTYDPELNTSKFNKLWQLDQVWKQSAEERIQWYLTAGKVYTFLGHINRERENRAYFSSYTRKFFELHEQATSFVLPCVIIIVSVIFMNRLFQRGEITSYLVRPVNARQLFYGRYLGLWLASSLLIIANMALFLAGGFSPEWRTAAPLAFVGVMTHIVLAGAVLTVPFLIAPLTGNLFRGAANFIFSFAAIYVAFNVPREEGWFAGLIPYRFIARDPFSHKALSIFQDIFLAPIPRLFSACDGYSFCIRQFPGEAFWGDMLAIAASHYGFWLWTAASGLVVFSLALLIWERREVR